MSITNPIYNFNLFENEHPGIGINHQSQHYPGYRTSTLLFIFSFLAKKFKLLK